MTLKQALLGATVLTVLPMAAQAQTTSTRRNTTTTTQTQQTMAPAAAPAATYAPAPVMAPVPAYNPNIISGIYISGGLGGDLMMNSNTSGIQTQYKAGYVGVAAIGYGFGNGLRTEIEGNYRNNAVSKMKFASVTTTTGGYLQNYGGMLNAYYDFDIGWPITPYVGAGVGLAQINLNGPRATATQLQTATVPGAATGYYINDTSAWKFAYQAIVGGAWNIGNGLALTLEYRFYGTQSPEFGISRSSNNAAYPNVGNVPHYANFQNLHNSLLLGFRYAFNQPAAPVVPIAAPAAAARTYLVFFDWNKYNLTDRARQIIAEAAQSAKSTGTTRIDVGGHTDTTGTAAYNERLSIRRAEAVAAELVRRGVPRNEIAIAGYGATRPLVATGPNVREPQNRRVEINLK
jgi:outer membrane protein OmpA-like peptidoglycan-associated protein